MKRCRNIGYTVSRVCVGVLLTNKLNRMKYKIFDIITDLIKNDITKEEAINKLLVLHNVIKQLSD